MSDDAVVLGGRDLTIDDIVRVARKDRRVSISGDHRIVDRVQRSQNYVMELVESGERIYGVTTGFGGMSNNVIPPQQSRDLQESLLYFLRAGAGSRLPRADVRASMLLRANSLLRGVSGVRMDLIRRFESFLNGGVTPHVRELGSIGASGDLVPLAAIAGAIVGLDASANVDFGDRQLSSHEALRLLGLQPLRLEPKEGLALVNGSSVMAGIATNCVYDARVILSLAMAAHALMFQAMRGNTHVLHPFIHRHKPHPGQIWVARNMFKLIKGSRWTYGEHRGGFDQSGGGLAQDRYSLRCLPQYMGPLVDGLTVIAGQVETEANSTTDNPLFDGDGRACYEGGNFLGQYIGVGMDQLRFYLGMMAKQLDAQIGMLVAPEFNNGLSPSLVGNQMSVVNMGLKGLQLTGNSIVPELLHLGTPLSDRFLTHAEQYNQNVNSLGFGAANLARRSVHLSQQYMAIALMFGVQAADVRAKVETGNYDGRVGLSPGTLPIYEAIYNICGLTPGGARSFVHDDRDQSLEEFIARIAADIVADGQVPNAIQSLKEVHSTQRGDFRTRDDSIMNVAHNILRGRRLFPKKIALKFEDKRYTYAELDDWSSRIASGMASLGISRGDRVALFLPNIPEFVAAYLAIQKLGAIAASLNSSLRSEETSYILRDCEAIAVFTDESRRSMVQQDVLPGLKHVIIAEGNASGSDILMSKVAAAGSPDFPTAAMDRDDHSAILYTSGTTGTPKGACLSHGNVISNMNSFNHNCGMRPDDRMLLFLPLFHCFGQNAILNSGLNACGTIVLHRGFQPETIIRSLADDQITMFFGVPATFIHLISRTDRSDMSSVRYFFSAAAPLPREVANQWREKFHQVINEGYGLTETSPFASYNHSLWYKLGSIGSPIENVEMRVVDVETGMELAAGESGEIIVRGPNVMLGYWKRPDETAQAIRNGWFHTGDIGYVDDDGYFYIVDRLKDMINVGGFKVYPVEVENTIYQHPAVQDVAVYGLSNASLGERVCANIVLKNGQTVAEAEIVEYCREQLADYKIPSTILFVDDIPKSPTGKTLKRVLRSQGQESARVTVRSATQNEIESWIRKWMMQNLDVSENEIHPATPFIEYGMTSILGLRLSNQLGRWLGLTLPDILVWNHSNLTALVRYSVATVKEALQSSDRPAKSRKNSAAVSLETDQDLEDLAVDEAARLLADELEGTE